MGRALTLPRHVFGCRTGYRTLAASAGVSRAEQAELESFSFGQTNAASYLQSLNHQPAFWCRPLSTGRWAVTRAFPGQPDDQGRSTLLFVTVLAEATAWTNALQGDATSLLDQPSVWQWDGKADLPPARATLDAPALPTPDAAQRTRVLSVLALLEKQHSRPGGCVVAGELDFSPADLRLLLAVLPSEVRASFSLGYRTLSESLPVALNCVAGGASQSHNSRSVERWSRGATYEQGVYTGALAFFWREPAQPPWLFIGNCHRFGEAIAVREQASQQGLPPVALPIHAGRRRLGTRWWQRWYVRLAIALLSVVGATAATIVVILQRQQHAEQARVDAEAAVDAARQLSEQYTVLPEALPLELSAAQAAIEAVQLELDSLRHIAQGPAELQPEGLAEVQSELGQLVARMAELADERGELRKALAEWADQIETAGATVAAPRRELETARRVVRLFDGVRQALQTQLDDVAANDPPSAAEVEEAIMACDTAEADAMVRLLKSTDVWEVVSADELITHPASTVIDEAQAWEQLLKAAALRGTHAPNDDLARATQTFAAWTDGCRRFVSDCAAELRELQAVAALAPGAAAPTQLPPDCDRQLDQLQQRLDRLRNRVASLPASNNAAFGDQLATLRNAFDTYKEAVGTLREEFDTDLAAARELIAEHHLRLPVPAADRIAERWEGATTAAAYLDAALAISPTHPGAKSDADKVKSWLAKASFAAYEHFKGFVDRAEQELDKEWPNHEYATQQLNAALDYYNTLTSAIRPHDKSEEGPEADVYLKKAYALQAELPPPRQDHGPRAEPTGDD